MNQPPIRLHEEIRRSLTDKLGRIKADGDFSVALAFSLASHSTMPLIEELYLNSDRHLVVRFTGEAEKRVYGGTKLDLISGIHAVAKEANLDGDELGYLLGKVAELK